MSVLVVDDQAVVRDCILMLLEHDGHEVVTAGSGPVALGLFAPGKYDLVFTDYLMPLMKGDELAAAVKALAPKQPVVMVTAEADELRASGRLPAGVDFLVNKPFTLDGLREAICAVTPEKSLVE